MLLTAAEAAARLGINQSQFRRAVGRGEMPKPCIKGRPHYWSPDMIDKYLAEGPPAVVESNNDMLELARGRLKNEIRKTG